MDILTHTLSGVAIGTVVSSYTDRSFGDKLKIVLLAAVGGALPDLDALSLWSKFDATVGALFNLSVSGKTIYYGKFWYSHHAFFHSILAGILITTMLGLTSYLVDLGLKRKTIFERFYEKRLFLIGFFLGFMIHLIEDMPTPASTWGGVNFFWPSASYLGGTGAIWWWNNYDIFLIVLSVVVVNLILHLGQRIISYNLKIWTTGIFISGLVLSIIQISTRDFNFAYTGHATKYDVFEAKSKQLQQEILGERLYRIMEKFDHQLAVYF